MRRGKRSKRPEAKSLKVWRATSECQFQDEAMREFIALCDKGEGSEESVYGKIAFRIMSVAQDGWR